MQVGLVIMAIMAVFVLIIGLFAWRRFFSKKKRNGGGSGGDSGKSSKKKKKQSSAPAEQSIAAPATTAATAGRQPRGSPPRRNRPFTMGMDEFSAEGPAPSQAPRRGETRRQPQPQPPQQQQQQRQVDVEEEPGPRAGHTTIDLASIQAGMFSSGPLAPGQHPHPPPLSQPESPAPSPRPAPTVPAPVASTPQMSAAMPSHPYYNPMFMPPGGPGAPAAPGSVPPFAHMPPGFPMPYGPPAMWMNYSMPGYPPTAAAPTPAAPAASVSMPSSPAPAAAAPPRATDDSSNSSSGSRARSDRRSRRQASMFPPGDARPDSFFPPELADVVRNFDSNDRPPSYNQAVRHLRNQHQ